VSAALHKGVGALLKYETHRMFPPLAAVLVQCTPEEWAEFQQAVSAEPDDPLAKVAMEVATRAVAFPRSDGRLDVGFAAGDYWRLGEAHEGAVPAAAEAEAPPEPEPTTEEEPTSDEPSLA
jgi:hypothetical protein